jgi:multidrug efflux pump subunit AcrB
VQPAAFLAFLVADRVKNAAQAAVDSWETLRKSIHALTAAELGPGADESRIEAEKAAANRDYAGQFGLTMADAKNSLTPATGSSRFTAPNYWRDPRTGNAFQIQVQLPSNRMQGLGALSTLPLMRDGQAQPQLDQVARLEYGTMPEMIERLSGQRIVSVTANLHGMPLGEAQKRIAAVLKSLPAAPKSSTVAVRGQIPALEETMSGLRTGLLLAIAVIFLLLMANFQSVRLPLAVLSTIPGVLCGVVPMLHFTGTTLNIQSFMGAIMAVGVLRR